MLLELIGHDTSIGSLHYFSMAHTSTCGIRRGRLNTKLDPKIGFKLKKFTGKLCRTIGLSDEYNSIAI